MRIFNIKEKKDFRRYLRNNSSGAESILWGYLKGKQLYNYKFRRQHGIGPYIVDFYCPELRLVIEIDGDTHSSPEEVSYDQKRTEYIETFDITVIRFNNFDVYENLEWVIEGILRYINNHSQTPP